MMPNKGSVMQNIFGEINECSLFEEQVLHHTVFPSTTQTSPLLVALSKHEPLRNLKEHTQGLLLSSVPHLSRNFI